MVHNVIRDMEVVSVFDEHPAGCAPARIAAEGNVRLKIRDGAICTVEGLLVNRLEEEGHRLLETLTSTGGSCFDKPLVETSVEGYNNVSNEFKHQDKDKKRKEPMVENKKTKQIRTLSSSDSDGQENDKCAGDKKSS